MLREYEFTLVTKADLPDGEKLKVVEGYEEILKRSGGEVIKKDEWGTRKLAYPIKKNFRGYYVHYDFASLPENIAECERLIRIDENVLRHLVIKIADTVDVEARKLELQKAATQANTQA